MKKLCEEKQTISDSMRREVLKRIFEEEDAFWGVVRSQEDMEILLDYFMEESTYG